LIAAGNSGDPALAGPVAEKLRSSSALVRAMAVWALARLVSLGDLAEFERRWRPGEADAMVEAEWAAETGVAPARAMIARAIVLKEARPS
jgi:epoxyqueuosine reductase